MNAKPVEKIVLIAALAFLAIGAAALAFFFPTKQDIYSSASDTVRQKSPEPLADDAREKLPAEWQSLADWADHPEGHRLFMSKDYLYDGQKLIALEGSDAMEISGKITLGWAKKYNLDLRDPLLFKLDPDGDGFYNELEFLANPQTNPIDKDSHPPFLTRLRLRRTESTPFDVRFRSTNVLAGNPIFYVEIPGAGKKRRSEVLKIGDVIPGTKWKIESYKENVVEEENKNTGIIQKYDRSELRLRRTDVDLGEVLIRGELQSLAETTAFFVMLLPGELAKEIEAKRGEDFSLPQDTTKEYKLLSASEESAVIRPLKGDGDLTVNKVTIEEERLVPGFKEPEAEGEGDSEIDLSL